MKSIEYWLKWWSEDDSGSLIEYSSVYLLLSLGASLFEAVTISSVLMSIVLVYDLLTYDQMGPNYDWTRISFKTSSCPFENGYEVCFISALQMREQAKYPQGSTIILF